MATLEIINLTAVKRDPTFVDHLTPKRLLRRCIQCGTCSASCPTAYAMDNDSGIADVGQAIQSGFLTAPEWVREMGFGVGMGLLDIRASADVMGLDSAADVGTNLWRLSLC